MGCISESLRTSTCLVVIIVFLGLLSDSMLLTLVDPILPYILYDIDIQQHNVTVNTTTTQDYNEDILLQINKGGRYGFLVSAKGIAQFFFNPFAGVSVARFGYRIPMLLGDILLVLSTMGHGLQSVIVCCCIWPAFAFSVNYTQLVITRLVQGLSSSVAAVTGLGILAATFRDDNDRGKVMGIAIGGLSIGIIIGPVIGSTLYQFAGKIAPFAVVAGFVVIAIVLQLLTFQSETVKGDHSMASIFKLMIDPYILIVAGNIFLLNLDVSVILAFLPLRLIELEQPDAWKVGIVVLPTSIGYLIAGLIFPRLTGLIPRWFVGLVGLVISAGTLVGLGFCKTFLEMLIVTAFLGLALGMVSTSNQPIFAHLVDIRHKSVYGNVYALSDMSVCLASFIGPLIGGPIVYKFGFTVFVIGVAAVNLLYSLLSILLRNPPPKDLKAEHYDHNYQKNLEKYECYNSLLPPRKRRQRCTSAATTTPTMDLSYMPVPHYLKCLSAVEELHRSVSNRRPATDPDPPSSLYDHTQPRWKTIVGTNSH